uniref:Uncharacterized protein n=1 Tax=Cacopsylla melanoneura TaxID=428564 RepID=A0A8D9AU16_9HEMI
MSSRTSFVLSSGVVLLLSLCSASYADFTIAEFANIVGTCYADAVRERYDISLPMDDVERNVANLDFNANKDLAFEQGVPTFDDAIVFLDDTVKNCFQNYITEKGYPESIGSSAITMACVCVRFRDVRPNLVCDAIGEAVVKLDEPLIYDVFEKGDLDFTDPKNTDVTSMVLTYVMQCTGNVVPLVRRRLL